VDSERSEDAGTAREVPTCAELLLADLRRFLAEATDIVVHIEATTGLQLRDLSDALSACSSPAVDAQRAAAVLAAGVDLAPAWAAKSAMRPHVVLARRTEAVRNGSRPASCDNPPQSFRTAIFVEPPSYSSPRPEGPAPYCRHPTVAGGNCRNKAVAVDGRWAPDCATHIEGEDRVRYQRERDEGNDEWRAYHEAVHQAQTDAARETAQRWQTRREREFPPSSLAGGLT
jgi:hypothetical protein